MRVHILYAIVTLQILVFQFISVRFLRAIPEHFIGKRDLPGDVTRAIRDYGRGLTARTYTLGVVLWIVMTLCVYVLPFTGATTDRLTAAAASVASSGVLVWTYLRAGRQADDIAKMLPDSGVRVASLERRTLSRYYNVAWEFAPFVILVAAAVFTVWAVQQLDGPYPVHYDSSGIPDRWGEGVGRFVTILVMQAVIAIGMLLMTFGVVRGRYCLASKAAIAAQSPSQAGLLNEARRRRELRFFMAAKIAVAVQFGLILLVRLRTALGNVPSPWMAGAPWAATIVLLIIFTLYAGQAAKGLKKADVVGAGLQM